MVDEKQKRRNSRFPVEQNLTASLDGQHFVGITRDVNAEGVFFFTSTPITEGSQVEVVLRLPPGTIFSNEVLLRAVGKAVRIERTDGDARLGVAIAFEQIQIEHSTASSSSL
jgi:PilZ domain-containing protein